MIIAAITLATLIAAPLTAAVALALFVMLGHFALGFLDDYIKVVKKRNLGLKARQKLLGQIVIAVIVVFFAQQELGIATTVWLPVLREELDIGLFYYPLVLFVLVGTSNAVNLTDGLDGLAAGTVTVAAAAYMAVALAFGATNLAVFAAAHSRHSASSRIRRSCLPSSASSSSSRRFPSSSRSFPSRRRASVSSS